MLTTERAVPLASRRRTAFVVMSFSLINFDALRASLVAVPRHRQSPFHDEPPPRPVTAARKMRGKETIDHLYDMLYPKSLVAGNKGTPVSVQAGVRRRARASRERERRTSCPVHATPARMHACDAAAAAADAALDRYHDAKRSPYGDEDGALHDVVRLSLAKDDVCVVDQWDKQE